MIKVWPLRSSGEGRGLAHRRAHGSDDVLDAAFRRVGVLAWTQSKNCLVCGTFGKDLRLWDRVWRSERMAAARGVLGTDALIECGGKLGGVVGESLGELKKLLPPHGSRGNPSIFLRRQSGDLRVKPLRSSCAIRTTTAARYLFGKR